jgi:hypothetical protein
VLFPFAVLNLLITQPLFCPIFSNFHILYNFICNFLRYFNQIMHLSLKYRKTHSNSCRFSRRNINYILERYPCCRDKPSHNSPPILSDFFKLPYIVQFYMYFAMMLHSNYALELTASKNALKLMHL